MGSFSRSFSNQDGNAKRRSGTYVAKGAASMKMPSRRQAVHDGNTNTMARRASEASQKLLLQVFLAHVAQALLQGRKVEPEERTCVTIFFSDIVGFTSMSSSMEAHLVMNMLDRLYTKFDLLAEAYDIFKGDALCHSVLQCDAAYCSVMLWIAVCCLLFAAAE